MKHFLRNGDSSPLFQGHEGAFNEVTQLIEIFIVLALYLSIPPQRNRRLYASQYVQGNYGVHHSLCQPVGFPRLRLRSALQLAGNQSRGTFCNKHSGRHAMPVHGQVYLT